MTKKTFAEKIAEAERASNEDSDGSVHHRPEGVTVEIDDVKPVEKSEKVKKPRRKKPDVEKPDVEKPVVSEKPVVEKEQKPKRAPSAYNLFVKECYKRDEVQKLPPKERFSKVAELWQKEKQKKK